LRAVGALIHSFKLKNIFSVPNRQKKGHNVQWVLQDGVHLSFCLNAWS
jgi:hypothetical protein